MFSLVQPSSSPPSFFFPSSLFCCCLLRCLVCVLSSVFAQPRIPPYRFVTIGWAGDSTKSTGFAEEFCSSAGVPSARVVIFSRPRVRITFSAVVPPPHNFCLVAFDCLVSMLRAAPTKTFCKHLSCPRSSLAPRSSWC